MVHSTAWPVVFFAGVQNCFIMKISSVSTNYASERLIENLKKAEDLIVPRVEILELKKEVKVKSDDYKSLTKKLKKE